MTFQASNDDSRDSDDRPRDLHAWVTLERVVALAMVATFAFVMLVVAQGVVVPLVVAGVLFTVPLLVSFRAPRGSALALGGLASVWLVSQGFNASRVVPELTQPAAAATFVTTVAMIVFSATGAVGFVGLLRGGSANLAARTWQSALVIIGLAAVTGIAANELDGDHSAVVTDADATVAVRDSVFEPAELHVTVGSKVTWDWEAASLEHDVIADEFASELKDEGTFSHTFRAAGTYGYVCTLHPRMTGTVVVEGDAPIRRTDDGLTGVMRVGAGRGREGRATRAGGRTSSPPPARR